jgi:hypothetical protein
MKTRRAKPGSPFRQERFMSDPALERGLLATCVASRVRTLDEADDRKIVWFLQRLSHLPGGMVKAAEEMISLWPERFCTEKMSAFGTSPTRKFSRKQSEEIFNEIAEHPCMEKPVADDRAAFLFRLHFSSSPQNYVCSLLSADDAGERLDFDDDSMTPAQRECRDKFLSSDIRVSVFQQLCRDAALGQVDGACGLSDFLFKRVCLDPSLGPEEWRTWYCPTLRQTLLDYQTLCNERAAEELALTAVTAKTFEALDYALDVRGLVLIQGLERRGKTFSAKAWCDLHPGEARYVKTPSTSDDIGFFREIARSLGIGCGQSIKTVELREKIEDVLLGGDLMLVFDNAHHLFRQAMYREAVPQRITWILTALVDEEIPVAFISTPQFTVAQRLTAEKSKWREAQLTGRIAHFEPLPEVLSSEDLAAVARVWLPGADAASLELLVTYAEASDKYIQAIGSLAQRAIYLAKKGGREKPTLKDIKEALQTGVIPSDNAIGAAMESAAAKVHPRVGRRPSTVGTARASKIRTSKIEDEPLVPVIELRQDAGDSLVPDRNFSRAKGASAQSLTPQ